MVSNFLINQCSVLMHNLFMLKFITNDILIDSDKINLNRFCLQNNLKLIIANNSQKKSFIQISN